MRWWLYLALGGLIGLVLQAAMILAEPWIAPLSPPVVGAALFLLAKLGGDGLLFFWRYDLWKVLAQQATREHLLFGLVGLVTGLCAAIAREHVGGDVNLVVPAVLAYLVLVAQTAGAQARSY